MSGRLALYQDISREADSTSSGNLLDKASWGLKGEIKKALKREPYCVYVFRTTSG
jgi:hypothetical protein